MSDIAGIGVVDEIDAICRATALSLEDAGASVEEIAFDASEGREPYQTWRGLWMVGQRFAQLDRLEEFGANLQGNVKAGLAVKAIDVAAAEHARGRLFLRFRDRATTAGVPTGNGLKTKKHPRAGAFGRCRGAYGIRTRAAAVRGRCPRPLDEWAAPGAEQFTGSGARVAR